MFSIMWFKWGWILLSVCFSLIVCHKALQWMEDRGWIYYLKKKATSGTTASAFLELHSLIEPNKKHVLKIEREEYEEQDGEGASDL